MTTPLHILSVRLEALTVVTIMMALWSTIPTVTPGAGAPDPINAYYVYQSGYVYSGDGYHASHVYDNSYGKLFKYL